jgi:hypothetical protein
MEMSGQFRAPAALTSGKHPPVATKYHVGGWVGLRTGVDVMGKKKSLAPCMESNPWLLCRPANWAITGPISY